MFFRNIITALVGASLVTAAPASVATPMEKGLKHKTRQQQKRDIIISQTVVEPQVVVINNNLDTIAALALQAEQEFAALVQSQLALISTVETIKNNIRVNHFKNRWNQVNTVIIAVTNVIDQRDPKNVNTRYMVNKLKADNNQPGQEILVMVNSADNMTIGPTPTPPNLNVPGVSGVGNASQAAGAAAPQVAQFDPNQPFGQIDGAVLLPFGSQPPKAPSNAQVFADPAAIILPNQGLFVGDTNLIQQDCQLLAAGSLFNLQAQLLANEQAIAQAELAGLVLGTAPPPIIIVNVNGQQGQQNQQQAQDQAAQQQAQQQAAQQAAQQQAAQQAQQQADQQAQQQQQQQQQQAQPPPAAQPSDAAAAPPPAEAPPAEQPAASPAPAATPAPAAAPAAE
ncbi:hypothetical protein Daus18300_001357 [Diaporthe australafricana]|uniref:Cas1p-like protein n=1 Tax=Diaporthe australafricana TaxID=127596 RepID=A0ABR3XXK9_9PEZI